MKKIALIGNPNCGKTTIFNEMTGNQQHVGNWPGVTVEKIVGEYIYKGETVEVTDLPGTYSFNPDSSDEIIARDYVLENPETIFVNVVDSLNFKRSMLLTLELLEMGAKVVLVLNMFDELKKENIILDIKKLSKIFNLPVVPCVANKGEGVVELQDVIFNDGIFKSNFELQFRNSVNKYIELLKKGITHNLYNKNWLAVRLFSGDKNVLKFISNEGVLELTNSLIEKFRENENLDISEDILEQKYAYIEGLHKEIAKKELGIIKKYDISKKIDSILTNRVLGIPIFILILWFTFQMVFTIGGPLSDLLSKFINLFANNISSFLQYVSAPDWINSLIVNGIVGGVGNIIVFLPSIMILFFTITILEDSGYMARAAFMMDKVMHILGLHGKSFIPFVLGFGCNVPAILATRTLSSKKDRILTIMVLPLMSCSARLPIYVMFTSIFFKQNKGLVILSLYLTGAVLAIVVARIFKKLFFKSDTVPLIMEIPPYRMPHMKSVWRITWFRSKSFLKKAGTVILVASVVVWFLASFPFGVGYATESTLIGRIGKLVAPLFSTAGFGEWQASVALIFGVMAKEIVVSTMGVVYASHEALSDALQMHFTAISAYSFMLMTLIYIPCIATIAAIKKEAGLFWAILATGYTLFLAWFVSTMFYQIARLIVG